MTARRVLFVCTGNTCRSPMAEAIARARIASGSGGPAFASAGTFAVEGAPASDGAVRTAARHGVDLGSHRSAPLTADAVSEADLVVAMTPAHRDTVTANFPAVRALLATELLPADDPRHGAAIPDPFGGTDVAYEEAWRVLSDCVDALAERLEADGDRT